MKTQYEGVEEMTLAVMGASSMTWRIEGREHRHQLPGNRGSAALPCYIDGQKDVTLEDL